MKRKIISVLCVVALILPAICVSAEKSESDLKDAVKKAIEWKDENDNPFYSVGTNSSNLYITALRRMGADYDYSAYLSGLEGVVAAYGSESNAADMQKTAIAVAASGGSAMYVGGRDLIADSTYYRDATAPVDRAGVGGLSWALIALDSGDYDVPDWAIRNRNEIIAGILSYQNTNGSFSDSVYDTACAITALAPYCATGGAYTITQNQTGWTFDVSPQEAVDNAIMYLSSEQHRDGDWGDMASTAMVVIALDSMNIDADTDKRFIARNGSALDGLMDYRERDGGFSSDLNKSDGEATSYALCALTSHLRKMQKKSGIFRLSVDDSVNLNAQATSSPSTNNSSSSSSSSTRSNSTSSSNSTSAKSSSTAKPSSSANPSKTMQPTKTASPMSSSVPGTTAKPRATRRPALVGPVELPGPMKPTESPMPDEETDLKGDIEIDTTQRGALYAIISGIIALLALCAVIILMWLNKEGKLENVKEKINSVIRKKKTDIWTVKHHRKTEEHRRFDNREKYRERRKFERRHR
ncbi:MAG: terpene cyclase/mutase family protein [Oscillospiraceae bacterium]|nr:terpene cyclase/mutase family protein [Oscillospiraceae bacterium]